MLTNNNPAVRIYVLKPDSKPAPTIPIQQQQSQICEDDIANQRQKQLLRKQAEQQQLQMD